VSDGFVSECKAALDSSEGKDAGSGIRDRGRGRGGDELGRRDRGVLGSGANLGLWGTTARRGPARTFAGTRGSLGNKSEWRGTGRGGRIVGVLHRYGLKKLGLMLDEWVVAPVRSEVANR
jgi:hypothetical protein